MRSASRSPAGPCRTGSCWSKEAERKFINQVPHTDHCVWLPVALVAYLDETADGALLDDVVTDGAGGSETVALRIGRAMDWLLSERAARGLSLIAQGDWCDPINIVGYKGRGVSGWLTMAAAYALNLWAGMCEQAGAQAQASHFRAGAAAVNAAANEHL